MKYYSSSRALRLDYFMLVNNCSRALRLGYNMKGSSSSRAFRLVNNRSRVFRLGYGYGEYGNVVNNDMEERNVV